MNTAPEPNPNSFRLLIVDDNPAIHDDIRKILAGRDDADQDFADAKARIFGRPESVPQRSRFELDSAFQGEEAQALVREAARAGRPYALAFVDVRMPPGWDGIETIGRLWEQAPDLQVVLCTAYSDYSWEEIFRKLGKPDSLVILKKPFDNIEVTQIAHALTEKWQLTLLRERHVKELDLLVAERTRELRETHARLLQEQEEHMQAQKMEAVGQLAAGVAHDFNNILQIIQGYSGMLGEAELLSELGHKHLSRIVETTRRAANVVRQLLTFCRKGIIQPGPVRIQNVLAALSEILPRFLPENIAVAFEVEPELAAIRADESLIQQVLMNLAVNARDAMPGGGRLGFTARRVEVRNPEDPESVPGPFLALTVADNGQGMPPEILSRVFEPFFTTKGQGKGTGLGLSMVCGIVKQHGGWVTAESEPGVGTRFHLFLPFNPADGEALDQESFLPMPIDGQETILAVEDEPSLREFLAETLQARGYRVLEAGTGPEALACWELHRGEVDLLLTDLILPGGLSGLDVSERLMRADPALKVIFTSGYTAETLGDELAKLQNHRYFISKPFEARHLLQMVRRCLEESSWQYP
jgi:signal transduction histidine kinase